MSIDMHRFVNVYKTKILIGIKMVSNIHIHIVYIYIIVAKRRALKSGALALYHQRSHLQPASLTSDILNGWILCVGAKLFLTQAIQESRTCAAQVMLYIYITLLDITWYYTHHLTWSIFLWVLPSNGGSTQGAHLWRHETWNHLLACASYDLIW